ncbi:MAG: RNA 2',3'-cyclic phosphodiesterase [Thermoplasmata archaeon]
MRSFVAIKVPPLESIEKMQRFFSEKYKIKLVEIENLHITLKFLGEIDEIEIKNIDSILSIIKFKNFTIKLKGAGAFPKEKNARVLWIGAFSDDLIFLGNYVSDALSKYNNEKFSAHLTIGRFKEFQDISNDIKIFKNEEFGEIFVDHFSIYKSTLTKNGPIYEEIKKYFSE